MYSLSNLSKVDHCTYRARSESRPEQEPYTITIRGNAYLCTCPAGQYGRCCKHVRVLRYCLIAANILRDNKPKPGEHCCAMDGWCGYPRLWLWHAVRELTWWDQESELSRLCGVGLRQMYLCDGCRAWAERLLTRIGQVERELGLTKPT